MGFIEAFWRWLSGQSQAESGQDYDYGDTAQQMSELKCGTFIRHRKYKYVGVWQEMDDVQGYWEGAYHAYTNALIDGDQEQVKDLWECMIEIDDQAAELIEKIEIYMANQRRAA